MRALVAAAVIYTALGAALGVLCARRSVAAVWSLAIAALLFLLRRAAYTYPVLRWPALLTPGGIVSVAGQGKSDALEGVLRAGTPVLAVAFAAWVGWAVVTASTVGPDPEPRATPELANRRDSRRRAPATQAFVATALACLTIGVFLPSILRDALPWRLQPTWLLDKAEHHSSVDVTNAFLADLSSGRIASAARYTDGAPPRQLLTIFYRSLTATGRPAIVTLPSDSPEPGQVAVQKDGLALTFCLHRDDHRWRIESVGTISCRATQ
jgi:hypothetical protein